ncbi:MAG TPA: SusC/RagA family TonB-linked outer membrane protein, partial [Puia sp.]|nr:SusC/RagA family TonB-linked outer membrane protein [Puia sp.]
MCVSPDLLAANNVLFLLSKREHLFSFIRLIPFTPKIGFPRLFLFVTMLCVGGFASFGQQKIKGIITGTNGQPLSGVSVSVKGTARGAISDEEGIFKIAANNGEVLIFSSIGYNSQQVTVKEDTLLRLSLTEFISDLDQIVVTGYASEKVKAISGSVAIVKPKELLEIPAGQVEQMLQGKVAGLNVITSGEPGSASIVRLHGIGNFGDVTPLYIIDGVQGDINSINPYDIESLQVLKDAGSYAIYGVRGANGVIVITTKQGKKGKTSISYDGYLGWQEPLNTGFNYLNPQEQADLEWMAFKNSGQSPSDPLYGSGAGPVLPDYFVNGKGYPAGDPAVDPDLYSLDSGYQIMEFNKAGTDWYHELFKPAFSQSHTVSASGANDKNKYFFSLGYLDQQGTYVNTYLKRFTARINTDFGVNNSIHFGENLQIGYTDNTKSNGSIFWTSIATNYLPVYDIKGNWSSLGYPGSGPTTDNPLAMRVLSENDKNYNWQIFGNAFVEISFLKNFRLRSNFGGTLNYNYAYNYSYGAYDTSSGSTSSFTENSGYNSSWTWTNTLAFSKKIATKHSIDVMAGFEEINNYARAVGGTRSGYFTDDPNYRFLSNGDPGRQNNYSSATTSFLQSFFSRLDYSFDEKYLLTATIRRDGSSIFGPENRFGWFPAFSAGWRISQEKFLSQALWLKELKIRASWGETGFYGNTDPLNQYTLYGSSAGTTYYDIYGISSGSVAQGFSTIRIGNPKTGWEKDRVTNIGFESILWNGKLSITADWYTKTSQGLLFQLSLPDILGSAQNVTRPNGNLGNVQNTGIDLLVNSRGKFSSKAGWDLGITFTTYNNKIVKLNDLPFFDYALPLGGQVRNEVGHPMGSFFGYRIIGFF